MIPCRRNSNYPLERDPNKIYTGCCGPRGGRMVQGTAITMPAFNLAVTNPVTGDVGDTLWADEDFNVVLTDDLQFISIDNI